MSVRFGCPDCGASIRAPESAAGRTTKCPQCGVALRVPNNPQQSQQTRPTATLGLPEPIAPPNVPQVKAQLIPASTAVQPPPPVMPQPVAPPPVATSIRFNCPRCSCQLDAPSDTAGQASACPSCSTVVTIPNPAARPTLRVVGPPPAPTPPREVVHHQPASGGGIDGLGILVLVVLLGVGVMVIVALAQGGPNAGAPVLAIMLFALGLFVYFLPSIVASARDHHNAPAIVLLNVFLGWTLLGWVAALCWAVSSPPPK